MTRVIRSRRADPSRDQPLYARMLGLRHLRPSGFLCFVFLEGAIVLGILLALAELVTWWGVLVLPVTVALMVKLNDVVAGALIKPVVEWPVRRATVAPPPRGLRPAVIRRATVAESGTDAVALSRAGSADLPDRVESTELPDRAGSAAPSDAARAAEMPGPVWAVGLRNAAGGTWMPDGGSSPVDAAVLNGPPASSRQWADELNLRQQQAQQSAARRYE